MPSYITRTKSENDARQYNLNLTESGVKIIPVLNEINKKWEDTLGFNELDEEFLKKFYNLALKSIELNTK